MCGILFAFDKKNNVSSNLFSEALSKQNWRGPDHLGLKFYKDGFYKLGHNRLTILDSSSEANMPMENDTYSIIYNGEIYNHIELRTKYNLNCKTHSDTETILEGYKKIGKSFLKDLRGMFSIIIFNKINNEWIVIRDHFGIKPLYCYSDENITIFASETITIRTLLLNQVTISNESISEWKSFRRPLPGKTFFNEIDEVLPGFFISSKGESELFLDFKEIPLNFQHLNFSNKKFESLLIESINIHQINDYKTVSLLSGGLDSSILLGLSKVENAYTVGLKDNNEFLGAEDNASVLNRNLVKLNIDNYQLKAAWEDLITLRGEPLSLPNEGLIFLICKKMKKEEKVLLTGEGADELLFGYDKIFNWARSVDKFDLNEFIKLYSYNFDGLTSRFENYLNEMSENKKPIEFLEDFFINFHLPGLLRRMDFASMAASKEARVPFVDILLFRYMYRREYSWRYNNGKSKFPLHVIAKKLKLFGAMNRKKIGFSATVDNSDRKNEYSSFQQFCLDKLNW